MVVAYRYSEQCWCRCGVLIVGREVGTSKGTNYVSGGEVSVYSEGGCKCGVRKKCWR